MLFLVCISGCLFHLLRCALIHSFLFDPSVSPVGAHLPVLIRKGVLGMRRGGQGARPPGRGF